MWKKIIFKNFLKKIIYKNILKKIFFYYKKKDLFLLKANHFKIKIITNILSIQTFIRFFKLILLKNIINAPLNFYNN